MIQWYDELADNIKKTVLEKLSIIKNDEDLIDILKDYHPKGYLNIEPIQTLEEYFKYIRLATTDKTWFRGESCEHELLIPKLYRNINEDDLPKILKKEHMFLKEFIRRSKSIEPNISINDYWSWYFLAQHYGGPTRLLDWTTDAATALFMAINNKKDVSVNPIVYTLQPTVLSVYALNELDGKKYIEGRILYPGENKTDLWISNLNEIQSNIPQSPIPLLPAYTDPRIISQRSCFTLFGSRLNGFYKDGKEIVCSCCEKRIRHKLIIDGTRKQSLRKELLKIGVSSSRVYPGLEGITQDLNEEIFSI